jgi:hypothetical protein
VPGFDIGTEWLLILAMAPPDDPFLVDATNTLTARLRSAGHYLLAGPSRFISNSVDMITSEERAISTHMLFRSILLSPELHTMANDFRCC